MFSLIPPHTVCRVCGEMFGNGRTPFIRVGTVCDYRHEGCI